MVFSMSQITYLKCFLTLQIFDHFCCFSWEFLEKKKFKLLKMKQNQFYLIKQASEMSKITFSVIVYAPSLNKTTIKSNKKQKISSADTFFWMTRYHVSPFRHVHICEIAFLSKRHIRMHTFRFP